MDCPFRKRNLSLREQSNRMISVTRWQGSEPGGEGDTQVQQKALMPTDADVQGSCIGLLRGAWKRKQLLLIATFVWALLQTQIFVKPLNLFSRLMFTKPRAANILFSIYSKII